MRKISGFYLNEDAETKQFVWMWWEALTNQVGHRKPHPVRLCKGVQKDNLSARGARGGGGSIQGFSRG